MRNLARVHAGRPARFAGLRGAYAGGGVSGRQAPQVNAAYIKGLSPAAWYRWGIGTTTATGVSQWNDQSGNGRNLAQGTGASQPTLNADKTITFNGSSHWLQANFTLVAPVTYYLLAKQITWTLNNRLIDGGSTGAAVLMNQNASTPQIQFSAQLGFSGLISPALGTYFVACGVDNAASSAVQMNTAIPTTGNIGTGDPGGITVGAGRAGTGFWSNIQVKEVIVFAAAHSVDTRRNIIRYLMDLQRIGQ